MSDNEVVPLAEIESSEIDLNLVVKQGQGISERLKNEGIKEATYDNGTYFIRDQDNNTTTVAANGVLMQQGEHTTTVVFRNEGSSNKQALEELSSGKTTQKTLGAFSGVSQQRASQILLENGDE